MWFAEEGSIANLDDIFISLVLGWVALRGIRESKWVTNGLVIIKVLVCVFVAAAVVFFAYSGFEAVANLGEETKKPAKDAPMGLLGRHSHRHRRRGRTELGHPCRHRRDGMHRLRSLP